MKAKTIEKILRGKFAKFAQSIKDDFVKSLVMKNSMITGGAIVSLILNEKVNDYDIYFTNRDTAVAVANYYRGIIIENNPDLKDKTSVTTDDEGRVTFFVSSSGRFNTDSKIKGKYMPQVITDNAISLSNGIQLILRFYGDPEEIHKNYDFVHVKSYWLSSNGKLYLNPDSLEAILAKELRYTGSLYPLASIFRLRKFLSRGWTITAGDIFKMAFQLQAYDLSSPTVLRDQLIGVDIHYFSSLIDIINKDLESKKISSIDESYVMQLVDEIFNYNDDYDINAYQNTDDDDDNNENQNDE